jgi:serine/threonine protein kinase
MPLTAGTRLGPYEIVSAIGAGGMGEVYRAKDSRLGRTVAIKVLAQRVTDSPTRRQRFEREARAASRLSHPHICALYDIGEQDQVHFIVMEFLEGETLGERLRRGPLPLTQVLCRAIEIADALGHAHRQGIVHRDLKPANVMLTRTGAKLLDFGIARITESEVGEANSEASGVIDTQPLTEEGLILGTLQYMAPEQLEGQETDARTDIFALGSVLYAMATAQPAFEGTSRASLMAAILEHEPRPLSAARSGSTSTGSSDEEPMPPLLDRVVATCLAKDPDERWQSAADLRQALRWIAESGTEISTPAPSTTRAAPRRRRLVWMAAALSLAIAAVFSLSSRLNLTNAQPLAGATFKQLTFRRGWPTEARFAPDGQTIVYSSFWDGAVRLFETRPSGPESRRLGSPSTGLASISSSNELALLSDCRLDGNPVCSGTLARMPVSGDAARKILEDVVSADWTPDARELAVIHVAQGEYRVEFPIGKRLFGTTGSLNNLSFSPRGDRLAFIEYPLLSDESGMLKIIDLEGRVTTMSTEWKTIHGLRWSPNGHEVWFTGSPNEKSCSLYAMSMAGDIRLIFHAPGDMTLLDISRDGRLLLSASSSPPRGRMIWATAGQERELSWLDWSSVADMSADGKTVLFYEWGAGVGAVPVVYLRSTDGSDAVRLGEGKALSLSPDGRWALALVEGARQQLVLLPTGTGQSRVLPTEGLTDVYWARWFPDGRRLLLVAARADSIPRSFVQDVETGGLEQVADDGTMAMLVSPDGRQVLARDPLGSYYRWPLSGGNPVPVEGLRVEDVPIQWSADGRYLYLRSGEKDVLHIYRYTLATRRRELWQELAPRDATEVMGVATGRGEVAMTADGRSYVFTYWEDRKDLFLVDGLRP